MDDKTEGELKRRRDVIVSGVNRHASCRRDATDRAGWGGIDTKPCFVIALEVLDNLPHDRLCWINASSSSGGGGIGGGGGGGMIEGGREGGEWMQTRITGQPSSNATTETTEPLTDPLLARTAAAMELRPGGAWGAARRAFDALTGRPEAVFVPTGSMALLEALHAARPRHRLIAADFDSLPGVRISGANAPLVASQESGGKSTDHDSYLENPGGADIFFPTDFENLVRINAAAAASASGVAGDDDDDDDDAGGATNGVVMTTRQFMTQHADLEMTATASGYNPLLQDFSNTKFFLS